MNKPQPRFESASYKTSAEFFALSALGCTAAGALSVSNWPLSEKAMAQYYYLKIAESKTHS
jgi:hypothetical protein